MTNRRWGFGMVVVLIIILNMSVWTKGPIKLRGTETTVDVDNGQRYVASRSDWGDFYSDDDDMLPDIIATVPPSDSDGHDGVNPQSVDNGIVQLEKPKLPGDGEVAHDKDNPSLLDFGSIRKGTHPDVYMKMFGSILNSANRSQFFPTPDYKAIREGYVVPKIVRTKLVNCDALLKGDKTEMELAKSVLKRVPKVPVLEEQYQEWCQDCEKFTKDRGYVTIPLTQEEEEYPLAFSIATYKDIEQTERLLRAVYHPQNLYCIHIDSTSPLLLHQTVYSLTNCFPNVFVASHFDRIKWGDVTVLLPAINCMKDFLKYHRGKWKYFINLTGQEFPLRTNWELVQFAKILNGSNDIGGSKYRMEMDRVNYKWRHKWSDVHFHSTLYNTMELKEPDVYNLTFYKGEMHGVFAHKMVEFLVESEIGQGYFRWVSDTGHPTEHYWNTLNYNRHVKAPGGYEGPEDVAHNYSMNQVSRVKHWVQYNYGDRGCEGQIARGICVYGVGDLPWLHTRKELIANKLYLTYEYLAYDCLEERHRNRTMLKDKVSFDADFFKNLPTVKYGRKDGL